MSFWALAIRITIDVYKLPHMSIAGVGSFVARSIQDRIERWPVGQIGLSICETCARVATESRLVDRNGFRGLEDVLMTAATLRGLTCRDLAKLAKRDGVAGWHAMRKEELVKALVKASRRKSRGTPRSLKQKIGSSSVAKNAVRRQFVENRRKDRAGKQVREFQSTQKLLKILDGSGRNRKKSGGGDRLVLMVRDPYWLHASWELSRKSIDRAVVALGQHWHDAQPVLRLLAAGRAASSKTVEQVIRDIPIHGGVTDWYIDVSDPPASFQVKIGYLSGELFHSLASSNIVTTRPRGDNAELDKNWQEIARQCDKIYAMSGGLENNGHAEDLRELFEERLRRPLGSSLVTRYGIVASGNATKEQEFVFEVDSELLIYGATTPGSHVSFRGEPIDLREDGTFTVRVSLKEGRQVVPIVATRADGVEQRTTVVAFERNTKVLEALVREPEDIASS